MEIQAPPALLCGYVGLRTGLDAVEYAARHCTD